MDLILIFLIIALPIIAQFYIKSSYSKYEKINNKSNLTGFDVARGILDKNGLQDVLILETSGNLTDHYDPRRRVVKLSRDVYRNTSISSIAVAAHECGHAIQHKLGYAPLKIRSMLVPVVNFTSNIGYIFILIAFLLEAFDLLIYGVGFSLFGMLFQLITLPVEFNASKRASDELEMLGYAKDEEITGVTSVLNAAAFTYVAAALANFLQLLRYVLIFVNRRD